MADSLEDAEFWIPSHFLDDNTAPTVDSLDNDEEDTEATISSPRYEKNVMAFSPQSTLYGLRSWSTSSRESSDGASQGSSPPSPLAHDDPWNLLFPAEAHLSNMKVVDDQSESNLQILSDSKGLNVPTDPPLLPQPKHKPKNSKQQTRAWGAAASHCGAPSVPLGLSASAWPPLRPSQTQPSSGMRAVFLQHDGHRKEPSGTGVFLPRNANVGTQVRRRPACSTVLLPAKVVQALNAHGRLAGGSSGLDHDAIFIHNVTLLQKRGLLPPLLPTHASEATTAETGAHQEIGLPSEWTY